MNLAELLTRLPEEAISEYSLADSSCEIRNVAFLTEDMTQTPAGDVLYFSNSCTAPSRLSDEQQFSCVVMGQDDLPPDLVSLPNANIILLAPHANPFACYNAIQAVFVEEQRLTNGIRRLMEAHFSNQGLQNLIDEAATTLNKPIVVVDSNYRYIAYQLGALVGGDSRLAQAMEAEIANETLLEEVIEYIRDQRIDSELARMQAPFERFNELLGCNTMTAAVMVQSVCVAHVMMLELDQPFSNIDRELFSRLTRFVGQEMQKSEIWGPTSGEMGSYFLENLLNDPSPSAAITNRRMKALNFHPKEVFYVVCLHAPGEGLTQGQMEYVAGQLRPVLHHALYTRHHRQLVALLSRDADVGFSHGAERKMREVAALNGLTVGVSNLFSVVTETRRHYEQARAAIRFGGQMSSHLDDHGLYRYQDVATVHLLYTVARRTNLVDFCHPALLRLLEHDAAHGGELMETLFCYLQVAGSTARAAKLLTLHKNTMLYRLGRIREILGMSLNSGEDLMALQLGFRILIHTGLFSPRLHLERRDLEEG